MSDRKESESKEEDKVRNPLEAIRRAWKKAGVKAGHMTGRYGYDPATGLPVAEPSNQPIQAARNRAEEEKDKS